MIAMLLFSALSLFASPAMAAEDVQLWDSQTFTAPWTHGKIATSVEIANNNELNSAKVTIVYEALSPDGANALVSYLVQAVLEEEVSPGVWVPIATQDDQIKGSDEALQQVIVLSPGLVADPGTPEKVATGTQIAAAISRHDGVAPGNMRICILVHDLDNGHPGLTSITLSGYLRKHTK